METYQSLGLPRALCHTGLNGRSSACGRLSQNMTNRGRHARWTCLKFGCGFSAYYTVDPFSDHVGTRSRYIYEQSTHSLKMGRRGLRHCFRPPFPWCWVSFNLSCDVGSLCFNPGFQPCDLACIRFVIGFECCEFDVLARPWWTENWMARNQKWGQRNRGLWWEWVTVKEMFTMQSEL